MVRIGLAAAMLALPGGPAWAGAEQDCAQFENPELRVESCTELIENRQFQGAVLARVHNNRGVAYGALGDTGRAIEDFSAAVRLDPEYPEAYSNRGDAYGNRGDYAGAIRDYDRVTALVPDHAWAYYSRALIYDVMGDWPRAIEQYDQTLRLTPDEAFLYGLRGSSYQSMGEHERAAEDWVKAVELGGAEEAAGWQEYLTRKGYYTGEVDGVLGPDLRSSMLTCARDPKC